MINQNNDNKGMNCPQCGFTIKFNIQQLLMSNAIVCPGCHLRMEMQVPTEIKSHLQEIQKAQEMIETARGHK